MCGIPKSSCNVANTIKNYVETIILNEMKYAFKKMAIVAVGICTIASFSSCKSNESMYKKAYEKAQAQAQTEQQTQVKVDNPAPVQVTPVTPVTPAKPVDTSDTRSEKVVVVSGTGLKAFSVICGSFSLKTNAEGLQNTLKSKGYSAQIVLNEARKLYRVVASTFDDKASAVSSRDQLRATYPDAWLLYNK